MGYESRVIIALKHTIERNNGEPYTFSNRLVTVDLSVCGYGFTELFEHKVDWSIFSPYPCNKCQDDIEITKDCYGDTCTYTSDIEGLIEWLENHERVEHYRRFTPLIAMLKAYAAEDWDGDELIVIHYGY